MSRWSVATFEPAYSLEKREGVVLDAPVRRFVFLGRFRLDELYGQTVSRVQGDSGRLRGFSFSAFGFGGGAQVAPLDERVQLYREIEKVCRFLEERELLGTLDEPCRYFHGQLSMFFVPFHQVKPTTLYMVGEGERTFVALGGPLSDVCNRDADYAKSAEDAKLVSGEPEVARALARANLGEGEVPAREPVRPDSWVGWEADVVATHQRFGYYPDSYRKKDYEVLALTDEFTPADKAPDWMSEPRKGVLLGKPLFVATISRP